MYPELKRRALCSHSNAELCAERVLASPRQMDTLPFSKTPRFKRGKPHLKEVKVWLKVSAWGVPLSGERKMACLWLAGIALGSASTQHELAGIQGFRGNTFLGGVVTSTWESGRAQGPPGLSGSEGISSSRPVWLRKCRATTDLRAFPCLLYQWDLSQGFLRSPLSHVV